MWKRRAEVKIFFIERKWWAAAACLVLAAAMFWAVNLPASVLASASARQLPIYCVQRDGQKLISISFDAAWGNEDTQQLIDILGQYQVPATFFVVGEWVDKYPESVKALHDAGHEVMNHSDTHAHYPQLSSDEIIADLNACSDKIEAVTGVRPTLIRLPYGDYDDHSISAVRAAGLEPCFRHDGGGSDANVLAARGVRAVTLGVGMAAFHSPEEHISVADLEGTARLVEALVREGVA